MPAGPFIYFFSLEIWKNIFTARRYGCFLGVFGVGTQKFRISNVQIAWVAVKACGEVQTRSQYTGGLVICCQIAEEKLSKQKMHLLTNALGNASATSKDR